MHFFAEGVLNGPSCCLLNRHTVEKTKRMEIDLMHLFLYEGFRGASTTVTISSKASPTGAKVGLTENVAAEVVPSVVRTPSAASTSSRGGRAAAAAAVTAAPSAATPSGIAASMVSEDERSDSFVGIKSEVLVYNIDY